MQLEEIIEKKQKHVTYGAFIYLLLTGQQHSDFKGFEQKHFRYALLQNPDFKDNDTTKKMETYFINKPYLLNAKGILNTKYDVNQCLKNMIEWGYIESIGKKGKKRYVLTKKYFFESAKIILINVIKNCKSMTEKKKTDPNHTTFRIAEDEKGKRTILLVKIPDHLLLPDKIEEIRRKVI